MKYLIIGIALAVCSIPFHAADLEVTHSAKYGGAYGMRISLNDTAASYVEDTSPISETRYRARFYIRLNDFALSNGQELTIFYGKDASDVTQVSFSIIRVSDVYRIRTRVRLESGTYQETADAVAPEISSGWHCIELDWMADAAAGYANLWFDGVAQTGLTALANASSRIDKVRLGSPETAPAGATGTYDIDLFESRRESYIGQSCYSSQDLMTSYSTWIPEYSVADLVQALNAECPPAP